IDDHYEGTYDENGIAACKIKVTDEHGNMDWKYIYINVGLPKPAKTPTGNDFDTGATTTVVDPPASTQAPVQAAAAPAEVAGAAVSAEATLPRTGAGTWIAVILGAGLAALGASMVMITRRRRPATDHRHRFMIG
ncbi:MAG: LPXTG cell wall anchor domain-containing protein, partial [Acidimicrobiia bacterium]